VDQGIAAAHMLAFMSEDGRELSSRPLAVRRRKNHSRAEASCREGRGASRVCPVAACLDSFA
jgi:hypothetical protein